MAAVTSDYRFAPIPEALLYDDELSPLAVRIYGVLARHGMTPESCYPSHAAIAERVGCKSRSVQKPLRDLEHAGWISRVARFDDRGDRRSDGFVVRVEPALQDAPPAHTSADPPAQEDADPPRTTARSKESHENESHEERDSASPRSAARLALVDPQPDPFDEFWAVWPRKDDKRVARRAWKTAIRRAPPDVIIVAAGRYRDDPNREQRYTKLPATWLNGDCWDNGPLPPRSSEQTRPKGFDGIQRTLSRGDVTPIPKGLRR